MTAAVVDAQAKQMLELLERPAERMGSSSLIMLEPEILNAFLEGSSWAESFDAFFLAHCELFAEGDAPLPPLPALRLQCQVADGQQLVLESLQLTQWHWEGGRAPLGVADAMRPRQSLSCRLPLRKNPTRTDRSQWEDGVCGFVTQFGDQVVLTGGTAPPSTARTTATRLDWCVLYSTGFIRTLPLSLSPTK